MLRKIWMIVIALLLTTELAVSESGICELTGVRVNFPARNQKYDVYSGPGTNYVRGAKGKACVSTNEWIEVFGTSNGWTLVQYRIDTNKYRIGYIQNRYVPSDLNLTELAFADISVVSPAKVSLTDDPLGSRGELGKIPKGKKVRILATMSGWLYVEYKNMRGFVRPEDIGAEGIGSEEADEHIDPDSRDDGDGGIWDNNGNNGSGDNNGNEGSGGDGGTGDNNGNNGSGDNNGNEGSSGDGGTWDSNGNNGSGDNNGDGGSGNSGGTWDSNGNGEAGDNNGNEGSGGAGGIGDNNGNGGAGDNNGNEGSGENGGAGDNNGDGDSGGSGGNGGDEDADDNGSWVVIGPDPKPEEPEEVDAYLRIIRQYRDKIDAHEKFMEQMALQEIEWGVYTEKSPLFIALIDLDGDGVDELLFMAAGDEDTGWPGTVADLYIYTREGKDAKRILYVPGIYTEAGDYAWYRIRRRPGSSTLYIEYGCYDPGIAEQFVLDVDGRYIQTNRLSASPPDFEDETDTWDYEINGLAVSGETWRRSLDGMRSEGSDIIASTEEMTDYRIIRLFEFEDVLRNEGR